MERKQLTELIAHFCFYFNTIIRYLLVSEDGVTGNKL